MRRQLKTILRREGINLKKRNRKSGFKTGGGSKQHQIKEREGERKTNRMRSKGLLRRTVDTDMIEEGGLDGLRLILRKSI